MIALSTRPGQTFHVSFSRQPVLVASDFGPEEKRRLLRAAVASDARILGSGVVLAG